MSRNSVDIDLFAEDIETRFAYGSCLPVVTVVTSNLQRADCSSIGLRCKKSSA